MSCKSERLMFQAFLFVSFLANVCYSQKNLALNKIAETFLKASKSVDGDRKTSVDCQFYAMDICRIVVDLGAALMIKTVEIDAIYKCDGKNLVYSIGLQKNETSSEYKCPNPNEERGYLFKDSIACDADETYQFVVFNADLECYLGIREIEVFGNSSSNQALHKDAMLYVGAPRSVDGDYRTISFHIEAFDLVVDLVQLHKIDTVIVTVEVDFRDRDTNPGIREKFEYSIGLQNNKRDVEYNCQNLTHELSDRLQINDTITCSSNEWNRFVVFRGDHDCVIYFKEIQVFGSSTSMKMDWSCYLAILLAVLFDSVSWVHHVLCQLSFLGTNLIGVVVSMQGRRNNEK